MATASGLMPTILVQPAPRRHRRERIGHGNADHVLPQGHRRPVVHCPAVIAAAHGGCGDMRRAGPLDRGTHGEIGRDLTHRVTGIDNQRATAIGCDGRAATWVNAAGRKLVDIVGDPQRAVRMDPALVGVDEGCGHEVCVPLTHAAGTEDRRYRLQQDLRCDPPLGLHCLDTRPWIDLPGHRWSSERCSAFRICQ